MSYDVSLFLPEEGRSRVEIATSDSMETSEGGFSGDAQRLQCLAAALLAAMPGLVRTDAASAEYSECEDAPDGEGVDDSRIIELTALEDGTRLQITITDREIGISIPYGRGPDYARKALAAMWRCAEIVEGEGGYFTYDPQAGRVLDLSQDFEFILATYRRANERVERGMVERMPSERLRLIFPGELDRLPYLLHWLGLSVAALGLIFVIVNLTRGTRAELLVFVPVAAWFLAKILVIDPARFRAIGWSPALTFLSLFPPAALFLQLLLFFLSSRSLK
jgi:hypothetical protein